MGAAKVEVEKTEQIKENVKVPEPSKDIKSMPSATEAEAEAEELSETVDTIKNDHGVVVFFYSSLDSLDQTNFTRQKIGDDEALLNEIKSDVMKALTYDHGQVIHTSCWPFSCASAKKITHKSLNIDKLTKRPLIRISDKKADQPKGWLEWIFGFDFGSDEEVPEEDEEAGDSIEETYSEEEDDTENIEEDAEILEEEEDDLTETSSSKDGQEEVQDTEDRKWYSVNLLGDEDWFSINLFGDESISEDDSNWYDVNLFGDTSNEPIWYELNLLGGESNGQNWYDVILLGFCDDGIKHWYEVALLSLPGASGYEE